MTRPQHSLTAQIGSALIVALIFLLLMTLIGTAAMQSSTMQERMASNWRDWNIAFQSAEAGLRDAEQFLLDTVALPEFADADGLYEVNSPDRPDWPDDPADTGMGDIIEYAGTPLPDVARQPRYFIEELSTITPAGTETETGTPLEEVFFFRVTATGYGGAVDDGGEPVTAVTLSTVYRSR
jgi:type IV pilus assembly protein PilX